MLMQNQGTLLTVHYKVYHYEIFVRHCDTSEMIIQKHNTPLIPRRNK